MDTNASRHCSFSLMVISVNANFDWKRYKSRWNGRTFDDLSELDRRNLEDAIIHTIIFSQDDPPENNSSIYHVFERLNTGGMTLTPQEIRHCINHGNFTNLLTKLNQNETWRKVYGPANKRLKDQELILQFLALFYELNTYARPMNEFLNTFMTKRRDIDERRQTEFTSTFEVSGAGCVQVPGGSSVPSGEVAERGGLRCSDGWASEAPERSAGRTKCGEDPRCLRRASRR